MKIKHTSANLPIASVDTADSFFMHAMPSAGQSDTASWSGLLGETHHECMISISSSTQE